MNIINDEMGQGAAEYILLFGGVIVVAVAALIDVQCIFQCRCRYSGLPGYS